MMAAPNSRWLRSSTGLAKRRMPKPRSAGPSPRARMMRRFMPCWAASWASRAGWRKAVRLDPVSPQAQRELSGLVWMRTGDLAQARAELDRAPPTAEITAITVRLLEAAGEQQAAYAMAATRAARDPSLHVLAARAAIPIDPAAADRHLKAAPPGAISLPRAKAEIETDLALGRA